MKKETSHLVSVNEFCKRVNLSQSVVYPLLKYDHIPSERIADRIVITEEALLAWKEKNIKPPKEAAPNESKPKEGKNTKPPTQEKPKEKSKEAKGV